MTFTSELSIINMNKKIIHLSDRNLVDGDQVHYDSDIGGFTILVEQDEYSVSFVIHQIACYDKNGDYLYKIENNNDIDFITEYKSLIPYLHGFVKRDGCSNWYFDEQDNCMLHFCTKEGLINIGRLMAFCWDLSQELMAVYKK